MRFRNPANGYVEQVSEPFGYTLIFGAGYFAIKGLWTHMMLSLVLAVLTFGLSWIVYPFFAARIFKKHYLRKGWVLLDEPDETHPLEAYLDRKIMSLVKRDQTPRSEDARIARFVTKTKNSDPPANSPSSGEFGKRRPT